MTTKSGRHTPGPWVVRQSPHHDVLLVTPVQRPATTICRLQRVSVTFAELRANAALLAEATAMAEVLDPVGLDLVAGALEWDHRHAGIAEGVRKMAQRHRDILARLNAAEVL